ncbi:MAG TPA: hypothetical protein GXX49_10330 [Clostridiaceae bacterium]|jgi:hypothetical protein|nr:hypothetical protein [Clostridiaceae bacterium]
MQNLGFGTTVAIIVFFAFLLAFIKGRMRDKCLSDFDGYKVILELIDKNTIHGKARVEISGMEFIFDDISSEKGVHQKHSYLLYKNEYVNIQALIRFHDELDGLAKLKREWELKRTYHPNFLRRLKRKTINIFKTVRDSLLDLLNLITAQVKKSPYIGTLLQSNDAYVSKVQKELTGFVGTSYDPLLEHHIGKLVIFEMTKSDVVVEYTGVLKEYTDEFIEIMDVKYRISEEDELKTADLVVPRKVAVIRHSAE